MPRITWQRMVTLIVAPLFALAGLVAFALPVQAAPEYVSFETSCVEGDVTVTFTNIADETIGVEYGDQASASGAVDGSFTFEPGETRTIQTDHEGLGYEAVGLDSEQGEVIEVDLSDVCEDDDNGEESDVDPVTIDDCEVTVPALQGVSYFQDKGNDPMLDAGVYDAKHFYPSTTFTAHLGTEGNPKVGEWTIDVPTKCAPSSDDPVTPTKAPASGV